MARKLYETPELKLGKSHLVGGSWWYTAGGLYPFWVCASAVKRIFGRLPKRMRLSAHDRKVRGAVRMAFREFEKDTPAFVPGDVAYGCTDDPRRANGALTGLMQDAVRRHVLPERSVVWVRMTECPAPE
jgi:hypothetical protein